jgi:dehydrogenase/reductase SDR family protein 4
VELGLKGKVAVITGATEGIGRATALKLAREGASVAICARRQEPLDRTAAELKKAGGNVLAVSADMSKPADIERFMKAVVEKFGRVDILVNNAGTNPVFGPIQDIDERGWDAIMNTNVKSVFFLSKMAREAMLEHGDGGSIINVSSIGGIEASDVIGGYSVSKAALIMLTQVCAKTWGKDGIRVNCIAPGLIKTDFSRALWENEGILQNSVQTAALGRIGLPDEMAGAVVYFAGAASSFTTGQTLVLDGGRHL